MDRMVFKVLFLSLSFSNYLPTYLVFIFLSIYRFISFSRFHLSISGSMMTEWKLATFSIPFSSRFNGRLAKFSWSMWQSFIKPWGKFHGSRCLCLMRSQAGCFWGVPHSPRISIYRLRSAETSPWKMSSRACIRCSARTTGRPTCPTPTRRRALRRARAVIISCMLMIHIMMGVNGKNTMTPTRSTGMQSPDHEKYHDPNNETWDDTY